VLAARLRSATRRIADLRDQRDRDAATLAQAHEEALRMSVTDDELQRVRATLAEAQAALEGLRAERDGALREARAARQQRHAFLAGLAHELRNPLAPLSNGIELLRLTDADPAGRLRTRGIMERQVGHLMRIADELSDLARLSGGRAPLQHTAFGLADALRGVADRAAPGLQAQEMTLECPAEPSLAGRLRGDAQRVGQALSHLVDDVLRHAERGSTIRIVPATDGRVLALTVATAADLDEAAEQASAPLEDVDVDTLGLGVALALQLATLHGGGLQGRRTPGMRRVRFTLTLPLEPAAATAPSAAVEAATPQGGGGPAL
jgi:signal transduction histidine kinase